MIYIKNLLVKNPKKKYPETIKTTERNIKMISELNSWIKRYGLDDVKHFLMENSYYGVVWNNGKVSRV